MLPSTHARYPGLALLFREERTEAIVTDLRDGRLDAGLLALEADIGSSWARCTIARDPFVVAMPRGHRLARKARVAPAQLDGETVLLLDDGHSFRDPALAVAERHGAEENEVRATSLATLVQRVSVGSSITLLPELAVPVRTAGRSSTSGPSPRPRRPARWGSSGGRPRRWAWPCAPSPPRSALRSRRRAAGAAEAGARAGEPRAVFYLRRSSGRAPVLAANQVVGRCLGSAEA